MGNIAIYNDEGEIIQTGTVPDSMEDAQESEGRYVYKGDADPLLHKIVDGVRVDKTENERNTIFIAQQYLKRPTNIYGDETDEELDQKISDHFAGLIDPAEYRINQYIWLRMKFYPPTEEYNDIQVKLNSGIVELEAEGQLQLEEYTDNCLAVKTRFPKE